MIQGLKVALDDLGFLPRWVREVKKRKREVREPFFSSLFFCYADVRSREGEKGKKVKREREERKI